MNKKDYDDLTKEIFNEHTRTKEQLALAKELRDWRYKKYEENDDIKHSKDVLNDYAILALQDIHPVNKQDLLAVDSIGIKKSERFGDEILSMIKHYFVESDFSKRKGNGPGSIYKIWLKSDPEKRCYIGATTKLIPERVEEHKRDVRQEDYKCPILDSYILKYGEDDLDFEKITDGIEYRQELDALELYYIRNYNGTGTLWPNGLNKKNDFQYGRENLEKL